MKVLIDINHPAHVHLLRNVYKMLMDKGNEVMVVVKEIPSAIKLLDLYGIPYVNIGKKDDSIAKKGFDQLVYAWRILKLVRSNHIDIGVGTSINLPHVSKFSSMKSVVLDDDDDELLSSSIVIDISAYSEPILMFELMVIYPAHSTLILCTPYSSGTLSVNSVISLST